MSTRTDSPATAELRDDIAVLVDPPRRRRWVQVLAIAIGIGVLGFVVVASRGEVRSSIVPPTPLSGEPAPEVSGETLDGNDFAFSGAGGGSGDFIFLNFFGSWCAPCREEFDDLVAISTDPSLDGIVQIVGVTNGEPADVSRAWVAGRGSDWPIVDDEDGSVAVAYGVRGLPETFVIAPDGTVVGRFYGAVTEAEMREVIRQLVAASLGEQP